MTWFASTIYIEGSHQALTTISEDSLLAPFAFYMAGAFELGGEVIRPRGSEQNRLIAVHPVADVCYPMNSWLERHFGKILPSSDLKADGVNSVPLYSQASKLLDESEPVPLPFFHYLRRLQRRTDASLFFYEAGSSGGPMDYERVWLFAGRESVLVRYGYVDEPINTSCLNLKPGHPNVVITEDFTSYRLGDDSIEPLGTTDVLTCALAELGVRLDGPYFAPHTRGFKWSEFALLS